MVPSLIEEHPGRYIDIFYVITIFQRVKPGTVQLLYMAKLYCNLARSSWRGKFYTFKDKVKVSISEVSAQLCDVKSGECSKNFSTVWIGTISHLVMAVPERWR